MKNVFFALSFFVVSVSVSAQPEICLSYNVSSNSIIGKAVEGGDGAHTATVVKWEGRTSVVRLDYKLEVPSRCVEIEQACMEVKLIVKSTGSCDKYNLN